MNIKITETKKLEIYPEQHNKEQKIAETIFIEEVLGLKHHGDKIIFVRKNAPGLLAMAYLESGEVILNEN